MLGGLVSGAGLWACLRDGLGVRFEEGVHLVGTVDLDVRDILLPRWEVDVEVFV